MTEKYKPLLDMPHHTSSDRPRMSREARAAQFAPFAALTGFEELVRETGRVTDSPVELTEERKGEIDLELRRAISTGAPTVVTYFAYDKHKSGGAYMQVVGRIQRFDEYRRTVVLYDEREVPIDTVKDIRDYKESDYEPQKRG